MSKYFWEVNVRSDENKLSYISVLDGHPSLGPTTCLLLFFFYIQVTLLPQKCLFKISYAADLVYLGTHC